MPNISSSFMMHWFALRLGRRDYRIAWRKVQELYDTTIVTGALTYLNFSSMEICNRAGQSVMPIIAGLWDQWKNKETGERIKSCTMIISDPDDFVGGVHDRMPVLLLPDQFATAAWPQVR